MTTTDQKHRTQVRPSSRDPITHWLDVFTNLLAVPPAERLRIRDELEDHLRMRVDDLLILGMTEPEAVQKAVTELGETAELAKRFKEARTNPRRRILMHTALFTVAGLALTFSIVGMNPPANHSMNPAQSQGIVEVQPEDADISKHPRLEFDLDAGPLGEVLTQLAEFAGARLFVHWGSLQAVGLDSESDVAAIPSKGLEMSKVRELLNSHLGLADGNALTARMDNGLIEFGTVHYFDEHSLITVYLDVSDLVPSEHPLDFTQEFENLRNGISMVVEPHVWRGEHATGFIASNGPQISVRAPERVQPMVAEYIDMLRAIENQRNQRAEKEYQNTLAREMQRMQDTLESTHKKIAELQQELAEFEEQSQAINFRYLDMEYGVIELEKAYRNEAPGVARDDLRNRLVGMRVEHESFDAQREQMRMRILRGHDRLEDLERSLTLGESAMAGIQPPVTRSAREPNDRRSQAR